MSQSLDALFRPRSVAVIGASRERGSLGAEIFHNLLARGFPGPVYPVNPASPVVQSVRAYASIEAIPDPVDLAVLVVPRDHVLECARACGRHGVKGLIVITAGFGESGAEGRALQAELVELVRGHGMRMVGPNCLGLLNTDAAVNLDASFSPVWPPAGDVAFSSQSGALGVAILDYARNLGIGIRQFISVGNKADVSGNDLLEYWEADPGTRVILLYLESLGRPGRFLQIARRVSRRKPIVVVKSGRTEAGARAASSHTGSLAGLDVAADALFGQAGVIRTDTIEELFDSAMLLAHQPVPRGRRVGILTNAGGPGIMASDACESHGLSVPAPSEATRDALRRRLPPAASVGNPVDMLASAGPDDYETALGLMLADEGVDAVLVVYVPPLPMQAAAVAEAIRRAARGTDKTVLTCFMGLHGVPAAVEALREGRLPSYSFPESAAIALSRAARYGEWLARPEGTLPELSGLDLPRARDLATVAEETWLAPGPAFALLEAFGIPACRPEPVADESAAAAAATRLGFPVALKLDSPTLTHKTDVGGVALGLGDEPAVRAAFRAMREGLERRGHAAAMRGALVQPMAPRGVETFVGVTHDPHYGPLIGFGIGGVNVEIWRDVVFRVPPLSDVEARDMVGRIRGVRLLDGHRGSPPADRDALIEVLLRVSRMVEALPALRELDLNPLVALPPGQGVVAVDVRIRLAPTA